MAHKTLLLLPASCWNPSEDDLLESGDVGCDIGLHKGALALALDAAEEEGAWTQDQIPMPQGDGGYGGGTLKADVHCYMASATANEVDIEIAIQAETPGSGGTDLEAATSFAAVNAGSATVPATAGHLFTITLTLTNDDSVAAGDLCRFALRRDADDATNDDATGDLYIAAIEIWEEV